MQKQKIRIRLKSYEISLLNESCEKIIDTASRTDSLTMGPIPIRSPTSEDMGDEVDFVN